MTIHALRLPLILILSLALWMPAVDDMLVSSADIAAGILRYLAALSLAWFGVTMIVRLIDHYAVVNSAAARAAAQEDAQANAATMDAEAVAEGLAQVAGKFEDVLPPDAQQ